MLTNLLFTLLVFVNASLCQVGISGTAGFAPSTNAMLDISSTTKGLLIPRMNTAQRNALLATATDGLLVYDTDTKSFWFYNSTTMAWNALSAGNNWLNSGTDIFNGNIGNVGIGISNPTGNLHISANGATNASNSSIGSHIKMTLANDLNWGWVRFESQGGAKSFSHRYDLFSPGVGSNYSIFYNTNRLFSIDGDGKVKIGAGTALYPLDVAGDINLTGKLRANGNEGVAGNVLKKDASNNLAWQPPTIGVIVIGTAPAISNFQTFPAGPKAQITILNNEESDINDLYNPATGTLTIPSTGVYHFDIKVHLDDADAGSHSLTLERQLSGGGPYSVIRYTQSNLSFSNIDQFLVISSDVFLFAGDSIRLFYEHSVGTQQYITGSFFSWMSMHKVY